ncbi:hypothetical protein CVT24_008551 [Panaeolus cyanescens]|uniref:Uncharacterized protein n=1 Tax=Panaeolus cyanescens TaxID=181874 RepID=A0A409VET5_9AGAR|nr:hypothetical protein CVT24_008551 [Panaeolus cyanescens]
MITSYYFPHVLYSLALTSVSINLVGHRKQVEEDRARISAQLSILESIKAQLEQDADKPIPTEELQRLRKLALASRTRSGPAQSSSSGSTAQGKDGAEVGWGSVFQGKKPEVGEGEKISHWDQKDLDALRKDMEK